MVPPNGINPMTLSTSHLGETAQFLSSDEGRMPSTSSCTGGSIGPSSLPPPQDPLRRGVKFRLVAALAIGLLCDSSIAQGSFLDLGPVPPSDFVATAQGC